MKNIPATFMNVFLSASWQNLLMLNYAVDKSLLLPYLPVRTEIALYSNVCYISLVGFQFNNTKVKGLKVPMHTNFEEVNLRFYVRYCDNGVWKRGVVFIKELVPKTLLAGVANMMYNEHYESTSMAHFIERGNDILAVSYGWQKKGKWNAMAIIAENTTQEIMDGSAEEFITEHYFGYVRIDGTTSAEYEVQHPRWNTYKTLDYEVNVDFKTTYGNAFAFLNEAEPDSVLLAAGSGVKVFDGKYV